MAAILVADDNTELRELLAEALTDAGHTVTQCADGTHAISRLDSGTFDLVVTDVLMPGADGAEVMAAMRCQKTRPRLIVISGGGRIDPANYLKMARALGADEVMQKPFTPSRLIEVVTRLLAPPPAEPG
jgi:two-component system, chemotaxis family, chemotaxis protein CheY